MAGKAENSTIDSVSSKITISATSSQYVGGIVGWSSSTISSTYNNKSITGGKIVGGIVGYSNGTINNTYNTGNITGADDIAGIAGQAFVGVSNSYNSGVIKSDDTAGGIIGSSSANSTTNIIHTNLTNYGNVTGKSIGGIVGEARGFVGDTPKSVDIKNSVNQGIIGGDSLPYYAGGIVGYMGNSSLQIVSNMGKVSSLSNATYMDIGIGGIVGTAKYSNTISYAYNTAEVSSSGGIAVGGVAGYVAAYSTLKYSRNTGNVKGVNKVGGIVGRVNAIIDGLSTGLFENLEKTVSPVVIENIYNTGNISGTGKDIGGLVGVSERAKIEKGVNTGTVIGAGENIGGLIGLVDDGIRTTTQNLTTTGVVQNSKGLKKYVGAAIGRNTNNHGSHTNLRFVSNSSNTVNFAFGDNPLIGSYGTNKSNGTATSYTTSSSALSATGTITTSTAHYTFSLGSLWATNNSLVNSGRPYLKNFYW